MPFPRRLSLVLTASLAACLAAAPPSGAAQAAPASGYAQPPKPILDVLRAPNTPVPVMSPTRERMLLAGWQAYPGIARVATPYLKLAGVRVEPGNHSRHDTPGGYGIPAFAESFELVDTATGARTAVKLPAGASADQPLWSPDGKRFAFRNTTATSVELWICEAATGAVRRVPGVRLNPMLGDEVVWMRPGVLLVKTVPAHLGPAPVKPQAPQGPSIQESLGGKGQSSTYENRDTLGSAHDEALFDHYGLAQVALVDAATLAVTPVGAPGIYETMAPAPDGHHLLVARIHRPYSYVTTSDRFPRDMEVWDLARPRTPAVKTVASLPLADRVPIRGVPTGPRDFEWRPTEPATLVWIEALDGGDWNVAAPARDRVLLSRAPFQEAPREVLRTTLRFAGLGWLERGGALYYEYDENRHWMRAALTDPDDPSKAARTLWEMSTQERYANPGSPVSRALPSGHTVVRQEGNAIFLSGTGSSPDGDRPFLDRLDLGTLKTERLFRSAKDALERFLAFPGPDAGTFLTWHQSAKDAPNAHVRTLGARTGAPAGEAVFASTTRALTHIPDPSPAVRQIEKRLVKYKRADGLDLSFTLFTPPGYKEGTRVPTILYAYPQDFADPSKAGQVTGSQASFTRLRDYRLLLLAGYAIIDNASFPIIGDPRKAYDTYLEQLVADAKAAVDEAVRLGVADPDRIGVTGHSHGALMTANLLAHSSLFRAGVATSGSYNKTLTPFGFQNERRSVWEAPEVYRQVSTFFFADRIKSPLLIVHGADDANPGTTPLQAVKLFEAIRGNGGVTRLVMLPFEPHWYTALESNEHLVAEMVKWFDAHVKNAPPRAR
ncbi:prolyl oligopeptidase family serine peptidase [Mesoterricola sediminis]|uniref:Peptidase S9 prolyl oligopeptidase catalytic domain-containing protein n=1 Tax=Mesoterricola sediminis TaxID=2927980 RepID=A0AA48GVI2_9BACT|nr:prolyl oligopeptidase family serine peptidase [Mesoterricola sediminis]BDU78387.1 hypothetical protein METESE_33450 [Mesoterricola sediminis]